jgi:hypothetical protein
VDLVSSSAGHWVARPGVLAEDVGLREMGRV